jgi:hypothetical protein
MKLSVLIPHFKSKITAYSVAKFIEYSEGEDVEIIVINNSYPHESIKYLDPFIGKINIFTFNHSTISSHGIAYDRTIPFMSNKWFITAESDSFPTMPYLPYYKSLIGKGYDAAGSKLKLSGGEFVHTCGALYNKSLWDDAKRYCDRMPYTYFPNMSMFSNFASHLMVHNDILNDFLSEPEDFVELSDSYKPYSADMALQKAEWYKPVVNPFHNGCGNNNEYLQTYGQRTIESEAKNVLLDNKRKLVNRIGAEPGQWLSWYMAACKMNVFEIPTETKWMEGRINEQQEYTLNEAGIRHIWAGSSYLDMKGTAMNDVYEFKHNQIEELYNSLPEHQKIKI